MGLVYVGLTGGIGSGKTTAAAMFADFGAIVIDADEQARAALGPDSPMLGTIESQFGPGIVVDGVVDRQALASAVFADEDKRVQLERLVHPEVARRVSSLRASLRDDAVVIYDVPLLVEKNMQSQFDAIIVVQSSMESRLARLEQRGVSQVDATARMNHQATDEQRANVATYVIDNSGDLENLRQQCQQVWSAITA